jgi:hypothetical protein
VVAEGEPPHPANKRAISADEANIIERKLMFDILKRQSPFNDWGCELAAFVADRNGTTL